MDVCFTYVTVDWTFQIEPIGFNGSLQIFTADKAVIRMSEDLAVTFVFESPHRTIVFV
jgi:hypothetical protein